MVEGDGGGGGVEDAGELCNPGWVMDSRVEDVGKYTALALLPAEQMMAVEEFAHADFQSLVEEMLGAVTLCLNPIVDHR